MQGEQINPLDVGQLSTDCLPLPGVLAETVSWHSLVKGGGKGKLVGMGEVGGRVGSVTGLEGKVTMGSCCRLGG